MNEIKDLFAQWLNEYLINFGQVYEQQAGFFGGYRHINYISSIDNRQQAITPEQYALLIQTLQDATKNSDWGTTINLNLSVSRNDKFVDKNLKLNEIMHAIQQVPLPTNFSVTSIATAATIGAIAVGAMVAYTMLNKNNPLEQTLSATPSFSGVDVPNMSDEKAPSSVDAGISATQSDSSNNGSPATAPTEASNMTPAGQGTTPPSDNRATDEKTTIIIDDENRNTESVNNTRQQMAQDYTDGQNSEYSLMSRENAVAGATVIGAAALAFPPTRGLAMKQLSKVSGATKAASGVRDGLQALGTTGKKVPSFRAPTSNTTQAQADFVKNLTPEQLTNAMRTPVGQNVAVHKFAPTGNVANVASSDSNAIVVYSKHSTAIANAEKAGAPGAYGNEFSVAGQIPW